MPYGDGVYGEGVYGSSVYVGTLATTLAALTVSFAGTYESTFDAGQLDVDLAAPVVAVSGGYTPPPVSGSLAASLPALAPAFTGTAPAPGIAGDLAATVTFTVSLAGAYDGPSPALVDNDFDGLHLGGTAEVSWTPDVVANPRPGGVVFDAAVAFTEPTIDGFTPYYEASATTARRLRQRIVMRGRDVSFFRGVPTILNDYQLLEPLGYGPASVTFPQILGPFESPSDFGWLRKGAKVVIESVDEDTNEVVSTDYKGVVTTWNPSGKAVRVEIGGEVRGPASMRDKPVALFREQRDAGRLVWRMLSNLGVKTRPYLGAETGIELGEPGGSTYLAAIEEVLALSWTRSGGQWSTMPNAAGVYRTQLKDRTTVDFTVYLDDAQSVADLRSDLAEEPNEVFATAVTPNGKRINFGVYPGLEQGPVPAFPGALSLGDTGEDVRVLIRRLQVTRYLNADDTPGGFDAGVVEAVKTLQEDAGLTESGVVNSATWDALWDLSTTGFSSRWSRILPAASRSYTRKWKLTGTGSIIGRNPNYDPAKPRVSRSVDMGANQKRNQVTEWAKAELFDGDEQWTGTIRLTTGAVIAGDHTPGDPVTMMRTQHIKAGMNVRLPTLGGMLLHVSGVNYGGPNNVTLAVDTKARDAMSVWQVIQRNQESRKDPARAWLREYRSSGIINDSLGEFSEIGGILGQDAYLTGGEWNVIQVVAGAVEGMIRSIRLTTTPHAELFAFVTAQRISESRCQNMIGDPSTTEGAAKWRDESVMNQLDQSHVLLGSWGNDEDPGGYSPGRKSKDDPLTGKLSDDAGFNFRTFGQPVLYLAVYADRDTKINAGRIMWPQAQSVI